MKAFSWAEGAGILVADGKKLEAIAYGPPPGAAPTVVMLHEGLGCAALWRDFPEKLAAATGLGVFVTRAPAMVGQIPSICRAPSTI